MACVYWHRVPDEFRNMTIDCQAEMVATYIVTRETESYYNSEQSKKYEKAKRESADKGSTRIGR